MLYSNTPNCVMNNGVTTGPSSLKAVMQGDSLSPYLFIIAPVTLAINMKSADTIKGLEIGDEIT